MARITVTDLPQSDALDRQAMRAVVGGSRAGPRQVPVRIVPPGQSRILDYPPGFADRRSSPAGADRS